jgi:hypothetical protein
MILRKEVIASSKIINVSGIFTGYQSMGFMKEELWRRC